MVEKFIGDAVVAVFGFPYAHDDDAQRAVLAGLRIAREVPKLEWPGEAPLAVRIGLNTGETYLHTDVDPASGDTFLTGDTVNTAARLQSSAPVGGVVAGALTYELTRRVIGYKELEPVAVKGKSEPVAVWRAITEARRDAVGEHPPYATAIVGRDDELSRLHALLDEVISERDPRFVLLWGEAGIGKTRLVRELFARADSFRSNLIWSETRCPAYGDGVAFLPVAQLVRGCAGIRETDGQDVVDTSLDEIIESDPDAQWLRQRLHALLGFPAPKASVLENCSAWAHVLALVAARRPLILAIEDLHWADEALLRFLSQLATVRDVPLLVLGTARPELLEERGAMVSDAFVRLPLRRLDDGQVAELISSLFDADLVSDELRSPIVQQADGNPLFAEEFVRLLQDRGLVLATPGGLRLAHNTELVLPESVQAVIAARLDQLARGRKALLADASVVGSTFWAGSLLSVDGWQESAVSAGLEELSAREFVARRQPSSLLGDEEYGFWHALAHDVVYGQVPRAWRARKHAAAARWFETRAPERLEDLVHHYVAALDLASEVHDSELIRSFATPASRVLLQAGDRAMGVDVPRAEARYARALSLMDEDDRDRPRAMLKWAIALETGGRLREADDAYLQAVEAFRRAGDVRQMAVAMEKRAFAMGSFNDDEAHKLAEEAHSLIQGMGPSPETATIEADWVGWLLCMERREEALPAADRAIAMARQLDLPLPAKALGFRGWARCERGDRSGMDDFTAALEAARAQGLGRDTAIVYCNMGEVVAAASGPSNALRVHREGREFAERRGIGQFVVWLSRAIIEDSVWAGHWQVAGEAARELVPVLEEAEDVLDLMSVRANQVFIDAESGIAREGSLLRWLEGTARGVEPEADVCCDVAVALHRLRTGDAPGALKLLEAFRTLPGSMAFERVWRLPTACRIAIEAGDFGLAARLVDGVEPLMPVHEYALATTTGLLGEARGEHVAAAASFADAASGWHELGIPYEEAQALLGQGRCLVALGKADEAREPLGAARGILERLGAKPALEEADKLMDGLTSAPQV